MMKRTLGLMLVVAAFATRADVVTPGGDASAGKQKSGTCIACHGMNGVSSSDIWPSLAAQKQAYLVKQLRAFRDGSRADPLMTPMAKPLSDQDIVDLAAYFSTQSAAPAAAAAIGGAVEHAPIVTSDLVKVRPHPTRQYWVDKMPEGEGKSAVVEKCNLCHDLQRSLAFARPRGQWQHVVESMKRRGSPITDAEIPVVVNYLTKYFGMDSPPIKNADGTVEVNMKPCKPGDWPKGSSDFRGNWKSPYNIWVSGQQGGSIDIIDPADYRVLRRIGCVSAPDRVEFSKDGNTAYVPDRVEHNVTVIDTRSGAIKAKVPLIDRPNTSVLTRDYRKLYVGIWPVRADEDRKGYVQVFDTEKLKVTKTLDVKGGIHDPWMSPDGKSVLAMSPEGRFMDLFDTHDEHKIWTCCTEAEIGTMNMEASADGSTSRIFFSYSGYSGVVVIEAKTGKELQRVPHPVDTEGPLKGIPHASGNGKALGFHGGEISPDGKSLWVIQGSFVYRYELPGLKPLGDVHLAMVDEAGKSFKPPIEGSWLTLSPDGQTVYASRPGRNLLSVIDVHTMKETALVPTGEYPLHISIWPRGTP